jgi:uncharacterized protein
MLMRPYQTLIDGYNLLFTAGFEGRSRGRGWLERARQRLVKHLEIHLPREEHAQTLVVFDVSVDVVKARERELEDIRSASASVSSGIQVAFAFDFEEADDMLENLIRKHSSPKNLTVVSSDNRIRKCAMARRATSLGSDEYLNQLERANSSAARIADEESQRPEVQLTDREVEEWLREFGKE